MAKREQVKLTTPPFILSFPHIFEAESGPEGGAKKFGGTALWKPAEFGKQDKERWAAIKAALDAESMAAFKLPWAKLDPEVYKRGLRKGETKPDLDGFGAGVIFANLTSKFKPGVATLNGVDVSPEEGNDHLLYAGCLCRATVNVYSFKEKGKGVAIGMRNLQIISSNEAKYPRLDGRGSASEDFDDDLDEQWLDQGDDDFGGGSEEGSDEDY